MGIKHLLLQFLLVLLAPWKQVKLTFSSNCPSFIEFGNEEVTTRQPGKQLITAALGTFFLCLNLFYGVPGGSTMFLEMFGDAWNAVQLEIP